MALHAADSLPVVRAAKPDRVHLRRRCDGATAGARRAEGRMVRVRLPARQPDGPARRVVAAQRRLPAWFKVRRDTRTHDVLCATGAARGSAVVTQPFRLPAGGDHRSHAAARLRVRRRPIPGLRGRHARVRPARQRRASRGPQLQVPPAARHLQRRHRGAERARAARAGRAHRAERPRHDARAYRRSRRREPESLAVAALRRRRAQRRRFPPDSGGLLLQDVHVARETPWRRATST